MNDLEQKELDYLRWFYYNSEKNDIHFLKNLYEKEVGEVPVGYNGEYCD